MLVGILAIQGDYEAHAAMLTALDLDFKFIRSVDDLAVCNVLIIPGGESTTILKFILANGLFEKILEFSARGNMIMGTCAGAILLATCVVNSEQKSLELIDIAIARNAYGRQLHSKIVTGKNHITNENEEMVFIRAPKIDAVGKQVKILATYQEEIVAVRQNNCIAITFHPELSESKFWYQYLVY